MGITSYEVIVTGARDYVYDVLVKGGGIQKSKIIDRIKIKFLNTFVNLRKSERIKDRIIISNQRAGLVQGSHLLTIILSRCDCYSEKYWQALNFFCFKMVKMNTLIDVSIFTKCYLL